LGKRGEKAAKKEASSGQRNPNYLKVWKKSVKLRARAQRWSAQLRTKKKKPILGGN